MLALFYLLCVYNVTFEIVHICSYSAEEIEQKVTIFRKMLMEKEGVTDKAIIEIDDMGRPM